MLGPTGGPYRALTCAVDVVTIECGVEATGIAPPWQKPSHLPVLRCRAINP